jgi:hypothetical protein
LRTFGAWLAGTASLPVGLLGTMKGKPLSMSFREAPVPWCATNEQKVENVGFQFPILRH